MQVKIQTIRASLVFGDMVVKRASRKHAYIILTPLNPTFI